ncbi:MAG: DeoR/GlpR transcriptional regulator [Caldilineaceae bacterium]|nr:DeoR/GlpR transcriptional regulator [Caldilineaceae bacterium]
MANRTNRTVRDLLPSERREQIYNEIVKRHTVTIAELAQLFSVSEMTIRRDLQAIEKTGLIEAVFGGAVAAAASPFELSFAQREMMEVEAKRAIGYAAAQLVADGDTIALDGSTTTLQLARNLRNRENLTVFTNGIKVAAELGHRNGIRLIMTGGELYHSVSLVGTFARQTVERIRVDKLFFSVTGITEEMGLSGPSDLDAEIKAAMIRAADTVVLLADHTKFGRKSYVRVAQLDEVDVIVTDNKVNPEHVKRLEQEGIRVIVSAPAA